MLELLLLPFDIVDDIKLILGQVSNALLFFAGDLIPSARKLEFGIAEL